MWNTIRFSLSCIHSVCSYTYILVQLSRKYYFVYLFVLNQQYNMNVGTENGIIKGWSS